jgi:hypothetical protein
MRLRATNFVISLAFIVLANDLYAASDRIQVGDYLFIHAQVIGCNSKDRAVEVGSVKESGEVTFFNDITLNVENKTVEEITEAFITSWELKTGQQSKTIQVRRESDPRSATLKMLVLYQDRKHGCGSAPRDFDLPDWHEYFHIADIAIRFESLKQETSDVGAS